MENLIFFLPFFAAIAIAVISHKVLRLEQSEKEQQLIQLLETKMTETERKKQPEQSKIGQRLMYPTLRTSDFRFSVFISQTCVVPTLSKQF